MRKRGVLINGQQLVQLYQRRGWSQQDLAHKSGLDVRTIAKVRQGGSCDARTLQRISQVLGVAPDVLLAESTQPSRNGTSSQAGEGAPRVGMSADEPPYQIEEVWKIIDLRSPMAWGDRPSGRIWERYQVRKLRAEACPITLPYFTWGERIECLSKPATAQWRHVAVQPGDIVHSNKQWELQMVAAEGPVGSVCELGPIELLFVDAFHGVGQQWWQIRVAEPVAAVLIQILFADDLPCRKLVGTWAAPGQRQFKDLVGSRPFCFPDGSMCAWHIPQPQPGAHYQLAWEW